MSLGISYVLPCVPDTLFNNGSHDLPNIQPSTNYFRTNYWSLIGGNHYRGSTLFTVSPFLGAAAPL